MRILALLLSGCTISPDMSDAFCRWQEVGSWTAPADGAAWVEGEAGLTYWDEPLCPSHRCLDVPAGDTVLLLADPFSDGGQIHTEVGRHCEP